MHVFRSLAGGVFALLVLSGCQEAPTSGDEAAQAIVGIIEIVKEAIPISSELPGRISPTRIAEVRPRVGGIIVERIFEQGAEVAEGDPLFRIDAVSFEVEVEAKNASVARAEAQLLRTRQAADRARVLTERKALSTAQLETAVADEQQAVADLAAAKAALHAAQIDLDHATVRAPISGRIGRALVTEGALVSASSGEALATIQQLDPVYADILQPVSDLLRLREALRTGKLQELEPGVARVRLRLDDGSEYPHAGRLLFSEAAVERSSGQVTLRAEFPNKDGTLLPGLYVRVSIDQGIDTGAIAVPSQAIQYDAAGKASVFVVGEGSVAEVRAVTLGQVIDGRTLVTEGLKEDDKVIVDGFQKIGAGAPVNPAPWTDTLAKQASPEQSGADPAQTTE